MMTSAGDFCTHCRLPLGLRPMQRTLDGEACSFCCYGCCIAYQVKTGRNEEFEATWLLIRLGVGGFLSMNVMLVSLVIYAGAFDADAWLIPWIHLLLWIFATPALVILGEPYLRETIINARQGRLTSAALVVLGVTAAYAYSVFAMFERSQHVYFDTATMVLMLFTLGSYIEAAGRAKAARDLEPLLAAESESATVVENGIETRRPVRDIGPGMLVRTMPGERVSVDGVVVEGESHTDEAAITGESRRIVKGVGSTVIAGSVNLDGPLLIESAAAGTSTRWAGICHSVREALSRPSPLQRVADRVVGMSVPFVVVLGGLTTVLWARSLPFDQALLAGLAVLVVACPCAVGLAAPLATSLGIGRLARSGCLVRDPAALEALGRCRLLAFDKTGTLTSGTPRIVGVDADGVERDEVLARAAGLERHSEHGFARAVMAAANQRGLEPAKVHDVRVVPGRGVLGSIGGQTVAAGNGALMKDMGWQAGPALGARAQTLEASGHSLIQVGWTGRVRAVLALDDTPLPEARSTIGQLQGLGLHVAILTGDLEQAGRRIGAAVGIEDTAAGLSPEEKSAALDRLRQTYPVVAMVGDGLNDGLALAEADIGIAVGSATDLARETATVLLPSGGLWMLPWVVSVARMVRRTVITNLVWAFGYNLVALTLAALGLLQPVLAAAVMASSSLLLVVNSLRLCRLPEPVSTRTRQADTELDGVGALVPALTRSAVQGG
ncbi:heavy metal translocating P-type ATPase [Mesorhizobium sp. L-8-3]|uniref:heavy metal translocating P-type ATPase n=1 Tax=Mesorhizobium sp. L-8-3 TaxID=2744522 RepID=UPI001FD5A72F|nr:heavy metal translocating P-type ATPase [Mesorhizobium sp. L-8-3]